MLVCHDYLLQGKGITHRKTHLLYELYTYMVVQAPPGHTAMSGPANVVFLHRELGQPSTFLSWVQYRGLT